MRPKLSPNLLVAALVLLATVYASQAGKLRRYIYYYYTGSTITNLYGTNGLGVVTFPNSPDNVDFMPNQVLPSPPASPYNAETIINSAQPDYYGSLVKGYLMAPETGLYTFWLASDDEAIFYMNTNAVDSLNPAGKTQLCWVSGWSGPREWAKFPEQKSVSVFLEADKNYYVEIPHKEGNGGDHIVLGWQTPSGLVQQPMPGWYFQPFRDTAWGEVDVELVVGPVLPTTPGDVAISDGGLAVFFANVNFDPPVTYQWTKNNVNIPGATRAYYTYRPPTSDNYADIRCIVNGTTYGPASLLINIDKPFVVSAGPVAQNPTAIQVVFSEAVDITTATNLNNYTLPGTTISSATISADGRTVTLKVPPLTATQVYNLGISGVQDMAVPSNTMDPYTATFVMADGSISYRVYNTTFATDLASLRTTSNTNSANATYTNNAFSSEQLVTTTSIGWNLIPLRDNYVGQMIGYVTAPESGQYKFAIASDDHSILYLGTSEARSSKREICNYNGSTGQWNLGAQLANQQSALITLEAGKRYYIEAIYRDGTGGDGVTVCWQIPSGPPLPTANASVAADTQPFLIPAQYLSPFTAFGNVFFKTNLPATLSAAAGTRPVLRVTVDGTLPYNYQWYRDNSPIAGATTSAYTLPYLTAADNAATFSVVVTNNFSSTNSVVTTLTVTTDSTKPTVASVGGLLKQAVEVRFSEPVVAASAGNTANYVLLNSAGAAVAINSALVDPADAAHVTLNTAPLPDNDLMRLIVTNVADVATVPNVMNPSTNSFRALNFDAIQNIATTQPWSVSANGDQVLMTAGGGDIWNNSDACVFVYKTINGNFDFKVQGVSLPAVNTWCKMGLMARASTAANSRNVFNPFTPAAPGQNTYSAQVRDTTGGATSSSNDAGTPLNGAVQGGVAARPTLLAYPSWVRLQRVGNTIYYYYGANGTNWTYWTYYDSTLSGEGALPASLLVGLALTSHDTARTVDGVLAQMIAVNDGALRFTLQPTNIVAVENGNATFTSTVAGNMPYTYQWLKNNSPIDYATNANYTLTRIQYGDDGALFGVRVTNPYGESITSTNATLTVIQDIAAPTVAYYTTPKINIKGTEVKLIFSEPMTKASAEFTGNYQVVPAAGGAPLGILAAVLEADERTVTLTTSAQVAGTLYKVIVNNVTDLACCPPNPVAANSTDYFFYAGDSVRFAQRADGFVVMEGENAQRVVQGTTPSTTIWQPMTLQPGYSGRAYMVVTNVGGTSGNATISGGVGVGNGPSMQYDINFTRPATNYTIWVRGWNQNTATAGNDDSIYVGIDGQLVSIGGAANNVEYSQMTGWPASPAWDWRSDSSAGPDPMVITNLAAGPHTIFIWQREDGTLVDKIVIEPGVRSGAGNSTEPAVASGNGGLGDPESWDWIVPPPGAPTVAIVAPTAGQTFASGANIQIDASVTFNSPVSKVEYFSNGALIGSNTSSPYTFTWNAVPEGRYSLSARVTDVLGYTATSTAVSISVDSTKPVAYAVGSLGGTGIGVYFNDLTGLDLATATNTANYVVNNGAVTVTGASLEPDNLAVMLSLSAPIAGQFSVQIQNVADRGAGPNVMVPTTLQSTVVTGILNQDVGTITNSVFTDPILPGLAQAIGTDGFYVRAGGHDIWDNADGMHFVYVPIAGNFDVSCKVTSLFNADTWSKAGLMIREELTGDSRNHLIASAPTNGQNLITMQWRDVKAAGSASIATASRPTPTPIPNCWLRVTRTNNTFTFWWGTNGTAWTSLYTTNQTYSQVYVGLGTTSHNNGTNSVNQTRAYYRNVSGLVIPLPPSPALTTQVQGSNLVISWTSTSSGFIVKQSSDLVAWANYPGPITQNGNNYSITVPISAGPQFFRLFYSQ